MTRTDGINYLEFGTFTERLSMDEAELRVTEQLPPGHRVRLARYEEVRGEVVMTRGGDGKILYTKTEPSTYHYEFWVTSDDED